MMRCCGVANPPAGAWTGRLPMALLVIVLAALLALPVVARQDQSVEAMWAEELEALMPEDPLAYFELAEDVADRTVSPEGLALARQLFGLAGVLDPDRLGRSACLARADMTEDPTDRRRLLALASLLSPPGTPGALRSSSRSEIEPEAALAVVSALSHLRNGQGDRATSALREPGATELLESLDDALPGGTARVLYDARRYQGETRPFNDEETTRLLRLELGLIAADARPWSSDLMLTEARPLIEVDPTRLDEALGVDASRPYYRDGRWVAQPDGESNR